MNNDIGINEEKVEKLILDIYDYCEKIGKTLDQISEVVFDTRLYYTGDIADSYRKKFDMFKSNFPTIKSNLSSYATDFINLKRKINLLDSNMSGNIKTASTRIDDKLQPIPSISTINVNSIPKNNAGTTRSWR